MNRYLYCVGISIFMAACANGGGEAADSGPGSGTGGAGSGSGGSSPSGTGGKSPSGSGGSSPAGTGGAAPTGTGGSGSGGAGMTGTGGRDGGMPGTGGSDGGMPGTGGSDGGMMGTGGTVMPPAGGQSVTQRGGDPARTGHFVRPMLTKAKAATMATDATFMATYAGGVLGTPLYLENGQPGGKGAFFVATNSNNIYAFDETTGAQLWMKNAGGTANGGCDGQGKGMMAAPAIDPVGRTIFAVSANGGGGIQFRAHAYNIDDGAERPGWPVDLNAAFGGADMARQNQRGALLLVNGILYVPFGGQVGDCGGARGRVAAINIADPTKVAAWSTSDDGSAIWAPGGLASDGTGIFGITGNHFPNFSAPGTHGDSEEVFRLTGMAQLMRSNANIFYPNRWAAMDNADLDFGANSPLVMDVPGATPARMIAAPSKDGHVYFLDPTNLGGMGGQKFDLNMANEGMSSLKTTPASYVTAKGAYVVLSTQGARGCPAGGPNGKVMMAVAVNVVAGAIRPAVAWCAPMGGSDTSPVVTTTDGKTDAVVWYVDGNLKGFDGDTGAMVFSGGACQVSRWTSPIVAKGARIVAGGGGRLCSWSAM